MSDQDNNSGKPMSVDEKRELLKDMEISYSSKRIGDVDEAGNIITEQAASTLQEKRELLDDMEVTYTSHRVGDIDEAGNIVKDKVAQTVEEKRELLDDMEITYTSKRVGDAISNPSNIEQQLKDKADSEVASNIEERASEKLGGTAGAAAAGAYTAARNNATSQFVKAQQQAAKQRAEAAAQRKVSEATQNIADDIADKVGDTAGQRVKEGLDKAASAQASDILSQQNAFTSDKKNSPNNAPNNKLSETSPSAQATVSSNNEAGNTAASLTGDSSTTPASTSSTPTNNVTAKQKAPIALNVMNVLVLDGEPIKFILENQFGEPYANWPYTFKYGNLVETSDEQDQNTSGDEDDYNPAPAPKRQTEIQAQTDAAGLVEQKASPIAKEVFVEFAPDPDDPEYTVEYVIAVKQLEPIDTPEGLQQRLENLDFTTGPIDGSVAETTQGAIYDFQVLHNLEPTGQLNDETTAKLEEVSGV